jgi:sulfur-oxidizing protein SoxY
MSRISRRDAVLMGASVTLYLTVADVGAALATPPEAEAEIAKLTGGKPAQDGKIAIDLPEIAENGNTIPLAITVNILVVADGNPNPGIAKFHLTPLSGRAEVGTRIRLAATENLIVVAKTSDGKLYSDRKQVKVTIGGCGG